MGWQSWTHGIENGKTMSAEHILLELAFNVPLNGILMTHL